MANSSKCGTKKRVGRKRQPPLAQGPALQFVVGTHPDDFKAEDTMRHVRSHVMYKHRGDQRTVSPSRSSKSRDTRSGSTRFTRTPSPAVYSSDGALEESYHLVPTSCRRNDVWEETFCRYLSGSPSASADPLRHILARIVAATTADVSRSAPPCLEGESEYPFPPSAGALGTESLEELRELFISKSPVFDAQQLENCEWMRAICNNPMSFLSQVSVVCVYQDVADRFLDDTPLTVYAKTKLIRMISENLNTQTDDFTILSIVNLLLSEIGGHNEVVFDVHQEGLVRIVQQRGGIANLCHGYSSIATFLIVVVLSFTVLRGRPEPAMLQGFTPSPMSRAERNTPRPISPLYAPGGDIAMLYGNCSQDTFEIIRDMHDLTQSFVGRWSFSTSDTTVADAHLEQIYTRLLYRRSTEDDATPDWIYECCRIAALIYTRSIVQGMPLAQSGNIMYARSSGGGTEMTMITALHHAFERTDRARHWEDLCGVLLWVSLIGGAASWPSLHSLYGDMNEARTASAWTRKCFSLYAVRSSLSINFDHADVIVESQRTMLQVQHMISLRRAASQ